MTIIKAISKKVKEKIIKAHDRFVDGLSKRLINEANEVESEAIRKSKEMWQIIEDSSRYSSLGRSK